MDPLVSTDWLAARLGEPDLRVLDATYLAPDTGRDAAIEFTAGHIPGAGFLDLKTLADPASPLPMTLPPPELFAERMAAVGVNDRSAVVVYDASPWRTAARAWWMLRGYGVRHVAILDGGLAKWRIERRAIEHGEAAPSAGGAFTPKLDPRAVRDKAAMRTNVATGAEQVVDARSIARFTGAEPETRPGVEPGHIPGSRNLPYTRMLRPDGTYQQAPAIRAAFAQAGIDPARALVATCGSGVTAAVLAFAAMLVGGPPVAIYDGSWTEWGGDPATPKAIGKA